MSTLNVNSIDSVTPGSGPDFTSDVPPTFQGAAIGFGRAEVKTISGTSYTVIPSDMGKILRTTSSSPVAITVPTGLTLWGVYGIRQAGTGLVSVNAGSGATITSPTGLSASGPGSSLSLHVAGVNLYDLSGDLA